MAKYRKNPVVIDAWLWDGKLSSLVTELTDKPKGAVCDECSRPFEEHGQIATLEGYQGICPGDWIIKGTRGEMYICKPDIFKVVYEAINV